MTPNTNVRRLDLSCNQMLGDDGTNAVSELLLDNLNCVETFTLAGCDLQDAGAEVFWHRLPPSEPQHLGGAVPAYLYSRQMCTEHHY